MATTLAVRPLPRAIRRSRWPKKAGASRTVASAAAVERDERHPFTPHELSPVSPPPSRREALREAKPFSDFLTDSFSRQHDYLRISVTERCNLRCLYCMPEAGIDLSPPKTQLTSPEIFYLSQLFVNQGVNKIRLTGGEPTVRKDIVPLMQQIGSLRSNGLRELALTTNGISLHRKLDAMVEAGLTGVNISLDTLDPFQFQLLTRRQGFDAVMKSINRVQDMNRLGAGVKLKVNCVVMRGLNDHQIMPFVDMTRDQDLEVRFIEYMPFGGNKWEEQKMMPYAEMLDVIREKYPTLTRMQDAKNDTSKSWHIPGFAGRIGFITSMTHNFCGTCNRLRITSDGNLKVCLHGETEVSLRDLLRTERNGEPMDESAFEAIRENELARWKDNPTALQMDGEEGWMPKERQLLDVIGAAVKRKKAKHAGMGELENMKNRPMILIGDRKRSHALPFSGTRSIPGPSSRAWQNIPTHLLGAANSLPQIRAYSSSSSHKPSGVEDSGEDVGDSSKPADQSQQAPDFAPFGFQSLSGLFEQPPRGRYSRPKDPQDWQATSGGAESDEPRPQKNPEETEDHPLASTVPASAMDKDLIEPSGATLGTKLGPDGQYSQIEEERKISGDVAFSSSLSEHKMLASQEKPRSSKKGRNSPSSRGRLERHMDRVWDRRRRARGVKSSGQPFISPKHPASSSTAVQSPKPRQRNPFSLSSPPQEPSNTSVRRVQLGTSTPKQTAWGLPINESATESRDSNEVPEAAGPALRAKVAPSVSGADKGLPNQKLSHLTSSGDAHMVDVGGKAATRRVAIAFGYVRFSNPEPFRLVSENSNKKGDVLGVARIAGIMAAKRTSDLIPLCHPLPITKVEVDVQIREPSTSSTLWKDNEHGIATIQAQVECFGPTGVEMEALTAVATASLTVYDMCKAVDHLMRIETSRVVYKSGGKNGVDYVGQWARLMGEDFFKQRALELPDSRRFQAQNQTGR
ncbi:molybdenum cofactor biosynthesis prote [Hortaea werneckii]|nr:molybdenum cofactor biosynthesis prote [Hortaea werneckii]KAI6875544.1 molybdenum cofactor biosynthesis prote [Hortaea werneckii]